MIQQKKLLLFLFSILALISCVDSPNTKNCIEGNRLEVPSLDLIDFGLEICGIKRDDPAQNFNVVIDTQEKLEKYIHCSEYQQIDFDKYVILGGLYVHHQCIGLSSEELFICEGKLVYQVNLFPKDCFAVTEMPYFKLVERKYIERGVYFDINIE